MCFSGNAECDCKYVSKHGQTREYTQHRAQSTQYYIALEQQRANTRPSANSVWASAKHKRKFNSQQYHRPNARPISESVFAFFFFCNLPRCSSSDADAELMVPSCVVAFVVCFGVLICVCSSICASLRRAHMYAAIVHFQSVLDVLVVL